MCQSTWKCPSMDWLTSFLLPHQKVSVLACIKIIISLPAAGFDYTLASGDFVCLVVLWDFFN